MMAEGWMVMVMVMMAMLMLMMMVMVMMMMMVMMVMMMVMMMMTHPSVSYALRMTHVESYQVYYSMCATSNCVIRLAYDTR